MKAEGVTLRHICVCICTFKRPTLLRALLEKLAAQETRGSFTYSVVVADNDAAQSAHAVVSEAVSVSSLAVKYCCEPEQNIALARNRALQNATGDFIAFLDDDEYPLAHWLLTMVNACEAHGVAGVLAPVRPYFETQPPEWLVKGKFCERPEYETGYRLRWRETRTGNVLFRRELVAGLDEPFRRALGNGGEDQDFFRRMMDQGHVFIWCNEAPVYELVPPERSTRRYLIRRALLRGQNEKCFTDIPNICKSLAAIPIYGLMLPFMAVIGHDIFMRYLVSLLDHAGKLMGLVGIHPIKTKYGDNS